MTKVRTTVNLDEADYERIKEMADQRGCSAAQLIRDGSELLLGLTFITNYDLDTVDMLQKKYPRMTFPEIIRELMFKWRIAQEGGQSKDTRLIDIVREQEAARKRDLEIIAILTEIRNATTTTTE